jgi:hypothetical protein
MNCSIIGVAVARLSGEASWAVVRMAGLNGDSAFKLRCLSWVFNRLRCKLHQARGFTARANHPNGGMRTKTTGTRRHTQGRPQRDGDTCQGRTSQIARFPQVTDQEALDFHARGRPGKLEINPTKPMATQRDLSLAYSPGVAVPVKAIAEDPLARLRLHRQAATWWP